MSGTHKRYGQAGSDIPKRNNQVRFAAKVVANSDRDLTDAQVIVRVGEELGRTLEQREHAIAINAYAYRISDLHKERATT